MATYKRPLKDGETCEDSRVAYNPFLGQGAAKTETPVAGETPVAPKAAKKAKEAKEAEVPVEPEAEVAPVEAAE